MEWSVTAGHAPSRLDTDSSAESTPTSAPPTVSSTGLRRGHRRTLALLALPLLLLAVVATGCNQNEDEKFAVDLVNRARASAGLRPVGWDDTLGDKARAWAQHLADAQALSHSSVASGASPGWHYLAENVGVAGDVEGAQQAFMGSSSHRKNILDGRFTSMGVGIVWRNNEMWIVQEFRG